MAVNEWFRKDLINDEDVLDDTKIGINELAKLVAATGAAVVDFATLFYKHEVHRKTLLDIGILRFPDYRNPHFKVNILFKF